MTDSFSSEDEAHFLFVGKNYSLFDYLVEPLSVADHCHGMRGIAMPYTQHAMQAQSNCPTLIRPVHRPHERGVRPHPQQIINIDRLNLTVQFEFFSPQTMMYNLMYTDLHYSWKWSSKSGRSTEPPRCVALLIVIHQALWELKPYTQGNRSVDHSSMSLRAFL